MKKSKKKKKPVMVTGIFSASNGEFGFVDSEELGESIFIPGKYLNGAMHSDTVMVELLVEHAVKGKKPEGAIVKIIERGMKRV
ncbi:MAG: ribonuclease R, partial [Lachnospiraceae bacterium]|nr:ribonuclease R [Lachnospiraceae bacterium]